MKLSLLRIALLLMIPLVLGVGTAGYFSFRGVQYAAYSSQQQSQLLAQVIAAHIESVFQHQAAAAKAELEKHRPDPLLQATELAQLSQDMQSNLPKSQLVSLVSVLHTLTLDKLPDFIKNNLPKSPNTTLVVDNLAHPGGSSYVIIQSIGAENSIPWAYLLVQYPFSELHTHLKDISHDSFALYLTHQNSTAYPFKLLATSSPIQTSKQVVNTPIAYTQLQVNAETISNGVWQDLNITWTIFALVASLLTIFCLLAYYSTTLFFVGKDLAALRQIIRDVRQGTFQEHYSFCLLEFKGVINTYTRLGRELAEESGQLLSEGKDQLTKLPNREALTKTLDNFLNELKTKQIDFALIVIDIDNFAQITHEYSYEGRDIVIAKVANDIRQALRKTDYIARIDEQRFCALFHQSNFEIAKRLEYRLRQYISHKISMVDGSKYRLGWSGGVTIGSPQDQNGESLLERAFQAVDQARAEGGSNTTRFQLPQVSNA